VYSLDCWTKEKPLSASSDRTLRVWKVAEETHLVFRGHKSSIDNAQYLTDNTFVSAGQDGTLNLWKDAQKTPVRSVHAAHGMQAACGNPNWICSVAALKMSNIVATGSVDGYVRLWNASAEERVLAPVCAIQMPGSVNALAITPRLLVAGCGKEHKYGRWWNLKGSLNKLRIVRFDALLEEQSSSSSSGSSEDEDEDDSGSSSSGGDSGSGEGSGSDNESN
jgi:ribosomal RNA-processing protein 9